jgi:hypothetical protein
MPNRKELRVPSTPAHRGGEADAGGWVVVAFCVIGFAATVFLVSLSSGIG